MHLQYFGIKYPFTSNNLDEMFLDLNETYEDSVKSKMLHVIFTPKGSRLRMPDFGTNLVQYIFEPNDGDTLSNIKSEITIQVGKYVPGVRFDDISVVRDDKDERGTVVILYYTIQKGENEVSESLGIKI